MSMQGEVKSAGGIVHVAQALHGYRNGHELLATSRSLSRGGQRALLELSDLSGPAARTRGFESYISGYPVPGERLYAFARTWLATGGARPGSVWTHTLLLTPEQLAMRGVANLAERFRQPLTPEQAVDYESQLEIGEQDLDERSLELAPARLTEGDIPTAEVFEALCHNDSANLPIVLSAASSSEYEELLLHIWSLQWPELRERFSFCTGALSFRHVGGRPFDLQVVPQSRAATIGRSTSTEAYVLTGGPRVRSVSATWANGLFLGHDGMGEFIAFAWQFGPELGPDRLTFGRLAQLHRIAQHLTDREDWRSLLEMVGVWYRRPSAARALKSWALGESASSFAEPLTSLDRLSVLSRLTGASAFPEWRRALAGAFLQTTSVAEPGLEVFLSEFPTSATALAREELLRLSAEHLSADLFVILIRSSPDAVALSALNLRPAILGDRELWQSERARDRALTWLSARRIDEPLIAATVRAVVAAGHPVGLGDLTERIGARTIDTALDVLGEDTEGDTVLHKESEWASTLQAHPERGVLWLARSERPSPALAKLVLERLQPGDRPILNLPDSRWVEIAKSIPPHTAEGSAVHALVLGVGFHEERPSASPLLAEVFQTVHNSTEEGRLGDDDWDKLIRAYPRPPRALRRLISNRKVGRGRVLRRAIVEAFGQRNWPMADFLKAVSDTVVLGRIVTENLRTNSGKRLRRRLNAALEEGDIILSDLQRTALSPWIDT